jgi:hypothetical protein
MALAQFMAGIDSCAFDSLRAMGFSPPPFSALELSIMAPGGSSASLALVAGESSKHF